MDQENFIDKKDESNFTSSRGALKIEVSTSTLVVSAGNEFSIFVVIRNPFPVPVKIYSTETHIPVELIDELWRNRRNRLLRRHRSRYIKEKKPLTKVLFRLYFWILNLCSKWQLEQGPRVAIAASPEKQEQNLAEKIGIVNLGGDVSVNNFHLHLPELHNKSDDKLIIQEINKYSLETRYTSLFPGNSLVQHFVLKTNKWLTFSPLAYTFQIQIKYEVDNQIQIDTVPFSLNIRAAMASSIVGAIIGGILGAFVNKDTEYNNLISLGRTLLTVLISSMIVVVAFSRKSNVQQIVAIEDFWGGIFVGFLVGYSGESFTNSILGTSK